MVKISTLKNDTSEIGQPDADNKSQNRNVDDSDSFNENLKKAREQLKKQKKSSSHDGASIPGGLFSVAELTPLHEAKVNAEESVSEEGFISDKSASESTGSVVVEQTANQPETLQNFSHMVESVVLPKDGSTPYMDIIINSATPVDPSYFAEELAKYIDKLQLNIKEIELRVFPRELGQVNVKVSFEDGKVNISIGVMEQFKEHFLKNIDVLSSVLEANGIEVGFMDVMSGGFSDQGSPQEENGNYIYGEDILESTVSNSQNSTNIFVSENADSTINNMI